MNGFTVASKNRLIFFLFLNALQKFDKSLPIKIAGKQLLFDFNKSKSVGKLSSFMAYKFRFNEKKNYYK